MEIRGKPIAQAIYKELKEQITNLGVIPTLAVILVGDDPASVSYVEQKSKRAEEIGAKVEVYNYNDNVTQKELQKKVEELNNDKNIHGIIIQQPLPKHVNSQKIINSVLPQKDIDGFLPNSLFTPPVALAVAAILQTIFKQIPNLPNAQFIDWLQRQTVIVIGKGQTAGRPVMQMLNKRGVMPLVIDTKTTHVDALLQTADIIISSVGKINVLRQDQLKHGVILIGVGMQKGEDGKFHGDYNQKEIEDIASYYTPTPGGIGVVNVACLLSNLVKATEFNIK